jgi:hypothetical protein
MSASAAVSTAASAEISPNPKIAWPILRPDHRSHASRATNRVVPARRLNVNHVETEPIFFDQAVNAAVAQRPCDSETLRIREICEEAGDRHASDSSRAHLDRAP